MLLLVVAVVVVLLLQLIDIGNPSYSLLSLSAGSSLSFTTFCRGVV